MGVERSGFPHRYHASHEQSDEDREEDAKEVITVESGDFYGHGDEHYDSRVHDVHGDIRTVLVARRAASPRPFHRHPRAVFADPGDAALVAAR